MVYGDDHNVHAFGTCGIDEGMLDVWWHVVAHYRVSQYGVAAWMCVKVCRIMCHEVCDGTQWYVHACDDRMACDITRHDKE